MPSADMSPWNSRPATSRTVLSGWARPTQHRVLHLPTASETLKAYPDVRPSMIFRSISWRPQSADPLLITSPPQFARRSLLANSRRFAFLTACAIIKPPEEEQVQLGREGAGGPPRGFNRRPDCPRKPGVCSLWSEPLTRYGNSRFVGYSETSTTTGRLRRRRMDAPSPSRIRRTPLTSPQINRDERATIVSVGNRGGNPNSVRLENLIAAERMFAVFLQVSDFVSSRRCGRRRVPFCSGQAAPPLASAR
jgi:hypothetical protein